MAHQDSSKIPDTPKKPPDIKSGQLQIQLDEATAQGIYVNLSTVGHTESEFTFDFIYVQPQQPRGKVRARIITSPSHAKGFLMALSENVKRFEQLFGTIRPMKGENKKIGFTPI